MTFNAAWEDGQTAHDDWLNAVETKLNELDTKTADLQTENTAPTTRVTDLETRVTDLEIAMNAQTGGGHSGVYYFKFGTTTSEPPANGQIRFDSITFIQKVWMSDQTNDALDASLLLADIALNDLLYMQKKQDSTNYFKFKVTGITPKTGYYEFNVTLDSSAGANFTGNMDIALVVIKA